MRTDRTPSGLVYGIVTEVAEKPRCLNEHPMSQPAARQMDVLLCYKHEPALANTCSPGYYGIQQRRNKPRYRPRNGALYNLAVAKLVTNFHVF
jgi:hypothetical protein